MDVLRPQSPEAWRPGMAMAFAAHGLLLLALVMGLQWQTRTPDVVEAEMWSEIPTVATTPVQVEAPTPAPEPEPVVPEPVPEAPAPAQPAPAPEPTPEPTPVPVPKPVPAPVLKPAPARQVAKEVFMPDSPQVAEKLAKAREALAKASAPVVPPKAPEPVKPPPKPPELVKPPESVKPEPKLEPKPEPKPEPPKPQPPKPVPPPPPPVVVPPPKPVAVPTPVATPASTPGATGKAVQPKLNEVLSRQEVEKARQDNLKRMMAKLAEDALHAAGPSPEYQGRIRARIKPHIVYVDTQGGNPMTTVLVHCAPDGKIISTKVTIPSGSPAWDRAVLRALERTAVLPLNEQRKMPSPLQLEFKPRDF